MLYQSHVQMTSMGIRSRVSTTMSRGLFRMTEETLDLIFHPSGVGRRRGSRSPADVDSVVGVCEWPECRLGWGAGSRRPGVEQWLLVDFRTFGGCTRDLRRHCPVIN